MLVTCQCIEAIVANKWQIVEKGSRLGYLRCFLEHFGVPPEMVACLFNRITAENTNNDMRPLDILWALYFLKQNPTEHVGAHFCGCSPTTYRERIWRTIGKISRLHVVCTSCSLNFFWIAYSYHFCRLSGKIISITITETAPKLLLMVRILRHVSRPLSVQHGGPLSSITHPSDMRLPYP